MGDAPGGLLVLVFFFVPALGADATPPTPAYKTDAELSGSPAVGEARDLTVTLLARLPLEASLRLDAPHRVRVDGGAWNASTPEDGRASHTWRVVAGRAGFWHASLSFHTDNATYNEPADGARSASSSPGVACSPDPVRTTARGPTARRAPCALPPA